MRRRVALALLATALIGCGRRSPTSAAGSGDSAWLALAPVHAFEEARRETTDFARAPTSDASLGPNPYAIVALPGGRRFVGVLRGADAIVLLDDALGELGRWPAPPMPTALALSGDALLVAGEHADYLARWRVDGDSLVPDGRIGLPGVFAIRDVAVGPEGAIHVVEEHDGRLITLRPDASGGFSRTESFVGRGAIRVRRTARHVLVDCLLEHTIVVRAVDTLGVPRDVDEARLHDDGPLWGFDAHERDGRLQVVAGGAEDHPLDRREGFFGYVDSFVYGWSIDAGRATRTFAINASEHGVVVPKAIALRREAGGWRATIVGAGGESSLDLRWTDANAHAPTIEVQPLAPGGSAIAIAADGALVVADPLLDAWLLRRAGTTRIVAVEGQATRSVESRLGEALIFTTLIAPWNSSDGAHSRFTCETCHFEGYVDGRVHHTGRGEVHAVTKPLLGLFNNRPHFTRALDPNLTIVANNEFRVASTASGHDPWFTLDPADHPWVAALGVQSSVPPAALRRAFVAFLIDFTHAPNPTVLGRTRFDADERAGATVFRARCASCHAPRLVTDEPTSAVPFEQWETRVFDPIGAIVWARDGYEKTGVEPYVGERGARTPSLRRSFKKRPLFTNGSAADLAAVVARARFAGDAFFHDGAPPESTALDAREQRTLLAFLGLL